MKLLSSLLLLAKSNNVTEEMCVGDIVTSLNSSNPDLSCNGSMVFPPVGPPLGCSTLNNSPDLTARKENREFHRDRWTLPFIHPYPDDHSNPRINNPNLDDNPNTNVDPNSYMSDEFCLKKVGVYSLRTLPKEKLQSKDNLERVIIPRLSEKVLNHTGQTGAKQPEIKNSEPAVDISSDLNVVGKDLLLKLANQSNSEVSQSSDEEEAKEPTIGKIVDSGTRLEYTVKNMFIIGRDEKCDLVLSDSSVSRTHAVIETSQDGEVFIKAINKMVFIENGERKRINPKSRHVLINNDVLSFGSKRTLRWHAIAQNGVQVKADIFLF